MKTIQSFKAAFIQFNVRAGDISLNLSTVTRYIESLAAQNVKLAILPEMWSCGFDNMNLSHYARDTPEILRAISRAASQYNMVIGGSLPEASEGGIFNTVYVTDSDGSMAGSYRKVHLFSVTDENQYFLPGNRIVTCETSLGKLGLMICYDLRFPEICRVLALGDAKVVIISAQWPEIRIDRWDILIRARAIENQIYIIGANRCGKENQTMFGGHSVIVDPSGDILKMSGNEECTGFAEIDFEYLSKVRTMMPSLKERRPEIYGL